MSNDQVLTKECPKCNQGATSLSPLKKSNERAVVFLCQNKRCSYTWTVDGGAFVKDTDQLKAVFSAATEARNTLEAVLFGEKLNPATRALMLAKLTEYGLMMWMDGLKQGLVVGAARDEARSEPVSH